MTNKPEKHSLRYKENILDINALNSIFEPLDFKARIQKLYELYDEDEILMTTSFGTKSVFLLHLIKSLAANQIVHFINTSYHFPETLAYKEDLKNLLNFELVEINPNKAENEITRTEKYWEEHPRMCCSINKIVPLEPYVSKHKIWISGLMSYQTDFRSRLRIFEEQGDIIKFHPLIDIDEGEFLYYLDYHKLPRHPLENEGYGSIGCTHCTVKGSGRSGRWTGTGKSECGLHPSYFNRKAK